jgi:cytochrome P450
VHETLASHAFAVLCHLIRKRLRRTISPTFNVMHLKHMLPPMHEEVQVLMAKLEDACDAKQEVDIHAMFTRLTLDIIGTTTEVGLRATQTQS